MATVKRGIGIVHALTSNFAEGRLVGGFFRASSERDPPALSQGAERFFIKEIEVTAELTIIGLCNKVARNSFCQFAIQPLPPDKTGPELHLNRRRRQIPAARGNNIGHLTV